MPTALDAGRYTSSGFHVRRHRHDGRAAGLPPPSTWASAANSSGVTTAVECSRKSGPYRRQVSGGVLASAPLTGKSISAGLRTTWYTQFTADQTARMTIAPARNWTGGGAASIARSARRDPERGRKNANRAGRARVIREGAPVAREGDMKAMTMHRRASARHHLTTPNVTNWLSSEPCFYLHSRLDICSGGRHEMLTTRYGCVGIDPAAGLHICLRYRGGYSQIAAAHKNRFHHTHGEQELAADRRQQQCSLHQ